MHARMAILMKQKMEMKSTDNLRQLEEAKRDEMQMMQIADAKSFKEQQRSDESLQSWWMMARENESQLCVLYKKQCMFNSFIHSISIAPLQVSYYSEVLPTQHGYCAGVSRRSATGNCEFMTCPRSLRGS